MEEDLSEVLANLPVGEDEAGHEGPEDKMKSIERKKLELAEDVEPWLAVDEDVVVGGVPEEGEQGAEQAHHLQPDWGKGILGCQVVALLVVLNI